MKSKHKPVTIKRIVTAAEVLYDLQHEYKQHLKNFTSKENFLEMSDHERECTARVGLITATRLMLLDCLEMMGKVEMINKRQTSKKRKNRA